MSFFSFLAPLFLFPLILQAAEAPSNRGRNITCPLGYKAIGHRGPPVKDYWHMDEATRRRELRALLELKRDLTAEEMEELRQVHLIAAGEKGPSGEDVKIGNYFWDQIRRKSEALERLGYSPKQRSDLIRSGAVGFWDDVQRNYEAISENMERVQALTGDFRGALETRSSRQMLTGDYRGALDTEAKKAIYDLVDEVTSPPAPSSYTSSVSDDLASTSLNAAAEAPRTAPRTVPVNTDAPKKLILDEEVLKEMSPEAQRRAAKLGYKVNPPPAEAPTQVAPQVEKRLILDEDVLKEMSPEAQRRAAKLGYKVNAPSLTPEEAEREASRSAKQEAAATRLKTIMGVSLGIPVGAAGLYIAYDKPTEEKPDSRNEGPSTGFRAREEDSEISGQRAESRPSELPSWSEGWEEGVKLFDEIIALCEKEKRAGATDYSETETYKKILGLLEQSGNGGDAKFITMGKTALAGCDGVGTSPGHIQRLSDDAQKQAIACGKSARLRRCIDAIQAAGRAEDGGRSRSKSTRKGRRR